MITVPTPFVNMGDVYQALEKVIGIKSSTSGTWNAPKNERSFHLNLYDLHGSSGYMTGESKFCFYHELYKPIDPHQAGFNDLNLNGDIEEFLSKYCTPLEDNPLHIEIPVFLAIELLVVKGLLPRNEKVWFYMSW
jgi:hypothetical protein